MLNAPLYRNGIPKDAVTVDRIQTAIIIRVNGRQETFEPEEALMFLIEECGVTFFEAKHLIGD